MVHRKHKTNTTMIKSEKIKWLKNVIRIPKQFDIGPMVHDLWDSRIYVNT